MADPHTALARDLLESIRDDLLGAGPAYESVSEDLPRNLFPAGNLGPSDTLGTRLDDFRITEYSPSSIGLLVRCAANADAAIEIEGEFSVFYPVKPTLEEARAIAGLNELQLQFPDNWNILTPDDLQRLQSAQIKFRPKFLRRTIAFRGSLALPNITLDGEYHDLALVNQGIRGMLDEIADEAFRDPSLVKCKGRRRKGPDFVPAVSLIDGAHWDTATSEFQDPVLPKWEARIMYRAWKENEGEPANIEILLLNALPVAVAKEDLPSFFETHLFNPGMRLRIPKSAVRPFHLAQIQERNYRNDPDTWSTGLNCDTSWKEDGTNMHISTEILPVYRQPLFSSRKLEDYSEGSPTFAQLDEDPLPHLERVRNAMATYAERWSGSYDKYVAAGSLARGKEAEFENACAAFRQEIMRFESGIAAIAQNEDLRLAFRLMNRAFSEQGRLKSWRLFQLVFIVSNMTDFLERDPHRRTGVQVRPVVLWYPTGGGKTEAFLGLALAHAFWDRIRGKAFGITAWIKFPLRLLSIQQLERVVAVVTYADSVRTKAPEIPPDHRGDPFSVGLYAGGQNSTNLVDWPPEAERKTTLRPDIADIPPLDPNVRHRELVRNRKVDRCPRCTAKGDREKGLIQTSFDPNKPGFRHQCVNCGQLLSLHVSDTETLRFLPTIVVGTIDKLARLGRELATKVFFGYARSKCSLHGYFLQAPAPCRVLGCGQPTVDVSGTPDTAPGLLIQDELHFLKETLGAFDAHYETMILAVMEKARDELAPHHGGPWKVIGSTATIEGYADQIQQVYSLSGAVRFPEQGPTRWESFYAQAHIDDTQRYILGFRPQNMSHVDAVMKVLLSFHKIALPLAADLEVAWRQHAPTSGGQREREDLIRFYRTSLTYALNRQECAQVSKSFVGQLNPKLLAAGLPQFDEHRIKNLTGETGSDDIQQVLHSLEQPPADWIQAITATSLISHGVDIEILNFMVFRGQPHAIAEWIQAMSRVGRKAGCPAIIVNVYNPNRERDASYYEHHKKYIEHADSLIRVVPVTRFSRSALRKTSRGLYYNAIMYFMRDKVPHYYFTGEIRKAWPAIKAEMLSLLLSYYRLPVTGRTPKEERLFQELERQLIGIENILRDPSSPRNSVDALEPMDSLREVDSRITVAPSYDVSKFSRRRFS